MTIEDPLSERIKATDGLEDVHMAQCLNYLKATGLKTCLLINFGKRKVEIRRLGMSRGSEPATSTNAAADEPGKEA